MSLESPHVLVDGTFASPFVWVLVAITALLLALAPLALLFIGRRDVAFRRVAVFVALAVALLSPLVLELVVAAFGLPGSSNAALICLMPTRHIVRDWSPGVLSVLVVVILSRSIRSAPSASSYAAPRGTDPHA